MKNLLLFLFTLLLLQSPNLNAQGGLGAVGGCESVTITSQLFDRDLISQAGIIEAISRCEKIVYVIEWAPALIWLQRKDSTGTFVDIVGPVKSRVSVPLSYQYTWGEVEFGNLPHGTYRGRVQVPDTFFVMECGPVVYHSLTHLNIGFQAVMSPDFFTNEAVAGPTGDADIGYTFIDPTENDPFEEGYDFGEVVKINTEASQNYDLWWLAIFEDGPTYDRYRSNGWTNGTIPNDEFDLSLFWEGGQNWKFEQFHQYTVQFVVENSKCRNGIEWQGTATWNVLNRSFFICPPGTGCRFGIDEREITISPNPAGSVIRLQNFEPDLDRDYVLNIADMAGRVVKNVPLTTDWVDISGLPSGMFVVNILKEGKPVFNSKLVVNQ